MPRHRENTWIQKVFGVWFEAEEFCTQTPAEEAITVWSAAQINESSKNTHFSRALNPLRCERERIRAKGRGLTRAR